MNIIELKDAIINGDLNDDLLVLVADDGHFLANQYLHEIAELKKMPINEINCLAELTEVSALSMIMGYDNRLNLLRVDTFSEEHASYYDFKNVIVICDKIDKKLEKDPELMQFVVKMPKLADWQVKDYMSVICPSISERDADWLYSATKGNIYRIINELDKVMLFDEATQPKVLNALRRDPNTDLIVPVADTAFKIYDAVFCKNFNLLGNVLAHRDLYDFDPFGMATTLINKYRLLALTKNKGNVTDAELGTQVKQAYAIKKAFSGVTIDRCEKAIKFLSGIDAQLKNGELDLPTNYLMDYVINKLLTI